MPDGLEEIRDPIIRIFALEVQENLEGISARAIAVFYSAKKSLQTNRQLTPVEKQEIQTNYRDAEDSQRELRYALTADAKSTLNLMLKTHRILSESSEYFISGRQTFQRFTSIDMSLSGLKHDLFSVNDELGTLRSAMVDEDETAKKLIYERVLGEKLNQLDAPYLFDVVNHIVELLSQPEPKATENSTEALALLTKEASDLFQRLLPTNVDRRLLSAVHDYIGVLTERNFSPIKVDLFSNKLRTYLVEFKEELPGFAIAEISALLLSQEQVLRQFPVWRSFENDASQFTLSDAILDQNNSLLENIASETRNSGGAVSDQVIDAFGRLEETSEAISRDTTKLGIWRSVENFIKANIRHVIEITKNWGKSHSTNQQRYLSYLERLLPSLKLFVSTNEKYAWLLPVIHWLEESIKVMK